ncbi:thiamine pyrophosphate-binding protein [Nonomuraea rosea]|uniref:Thiamine pyrophosphate-binding protein n=1 Tax=Nonomuraea rosea TaxID=638574 RepID=A0ABP7A6Z1_9ACTN
MSTFAGIDAAVPTHAQAFAEAIAETGCTHVFSLMGDGNMHLLIALRRRGVDIVEARHESAAVAMAEGYGWSSGRTGICSVTHGPGLTHVATSLVVAARNHSPLVLIAAETPAGYQGAQSFDQASFAAACEAVYRRMMPGESPAGVLGEAIALARAELKPVVLGVAADLLASPVHGTAAATEMPRVHATPPRPDGAAAAERLAQLLAESARPVLIAGRGAMDDVSPGLMRTLAERFGAGLATTLPAKGLFGGHFLDLGIAGGLAHPAAERVLRRADLVVAIGAAMGRSTTQSMRLFADAHIVKVVRDHEGEGKAESLHGDAAQTLRQVVALTQSATGDRQPWFIPVGLSSDCWQEDLRDYAPPIPDGTVDPRRALVDISEHIPEDANVVISNGHCSGFAAAFVPAPARGRFYTAQGFGSIGQALTTAIGVALGAPGHKTVVFEGDAAFMMHAPELDTAARAGANLTVFVLNDQALGTEYQRLKLEGGDADAALVPPPDVAVLAGALGARHATIAAEDAQTLAAEALAPGLAVADVRTARSVLSRHLRLPHTGAET